MQKDNAVLRHLNAFGSNACRAAVITAMVTSMAPTTAIAATMTKTGTEATNNAPVSIQSEEANLLTTDSSSQNASSSTSYDLSKITDGTYTGKAVADSHDPHNKGDEWDTESYEVEVNVVVSSGKITEVKVTDKTYDDLGNGDSADYLDKAENGKRGVKGIAASIVEKNGTSGVDVVSNATISSNAIKAAVDNALQTAYDKQNPSTPATDEYTYGYAALTWAEYWANEGVQNAGSTASSEELDSRNESDKGAFDVVTRATTNHGLHRGSYQCAAIIQTNEGIKFNLATWAADGKSFTTTDGKTVQWNKSKTGLTMTCDGQTYTMKDYEITGLKYVPVKVKTADLDAFKQTHAFVANGETLAGGYGEANLKAYSGLVADVDASTHGLKTVTMNGTTASFSAADETGTGSGIKDQTLKTADLSAMTPKLRTTTVPKGSRDATVGSYGEFMRLDFTSNYGDLAANMQSVTWTYYGDDATYTNAKATFGTKFAADNWMHKSMGIQLGLTDSARCQLPAGTDGTGYWKVTIHALGYQDSSYTFQATADNIKKATTPVTEATKAKLQALYDQAAALNKDDYTTDSWTKSSIETETAETKDLLAKTDLSEEEASEQLTHLQGAIDALVSLYPQAGDYVLMNIPYADFYAAENNNTGTDIVTSATRQKTRSSLASGSYHVNSDGTDISGVTFAVKVGEGDIDWSKFTRVTDDSSVEITTSIKGKESTTTYTGKDALFESADYSYYVLPAGETPANYKELTVDAQGNLSFGAVEGAGAKELTGVTPDFKTSSKYGDYEIDFENLRDHMADADGNKATVYGAVVNAADAKGTVEGYGMRAVENIWKGKEIAWSCGIVTESHGSQLSSKYYTSMMGKTIKNVTFYTSTGTYTVAMNKYVPIKDADAAIKAKDASLDGANATVNADVTLPEGFDAAYQIDGQDVEPLASNARSSVSVTFDASALKPGSHTLTAIDKKDKFADISTSFTATTSKLVASFDAANLKLIAANDATDEDLANYLANISKVTVNGTEYSAQGRGAVKIFNADGSLNLAAANQDKSLVFNANGDYQIEVEATGYTTNLRFTYTKSADKTALNAAIEAAAKLSNDQGTYTAASWAAFQDALSAAQGVNESPAASDDEVANALSTLQNAQAALAKAATTDQKTDLKVEIGRADALNESDYTADSWKAYQSALAAAQSVLSKDDASAADVEAATTALKAAREALAKPSQSSKGNSTSTTTTTTTTTDTKKANASKKDASGLPGTGDTQIATVGIFAGIGAAIAAAGVAIRRRMQH